MHDALELIVDELVDNLERMRDRMINGVTRDQSQLLNLADRTYAAGLAFAVGAHTGETKDEVLARFEGMFVIDGPPKPKKKKLTRKKTLKRRSK